MSQAEELLSSLSEEEVSAYTANTDVEPHIIIGEDRVIVVPDELKRIAVQYDHNIETVTFDCPRYWDEHDMSKMRIYINYMRADGATGTFAVTRILTGEAGENHMEFDWTISRNVTEVKGTIAFLVCIKSVDEDGNEVNHWNSELNKDMYVSEGLECTDVIVETYPDVITQILTAQTTQSDYMQSSTAAPDYIKNRTHWASEGDVVLPYTELLLSTSGIETIDSVLPLVEGNVYIVTWDETKYICEAVKTPSCTLLGNGVGYGLSDTEEPFTVEVLDSLGITRFTSEAYALRSAPIRIAKVETLHKLNKHYLPDDIGGKSDLAVNDPEASGYVANRTHWKEIETTNTISFDGNLSTAECYLDSNGDGYVRVHDGIVTYEQLLGATYTRNDGTSAANTIDENNLTKMPGGLVADNWVIVYFEDNNKMGLLDGTDVVLPKGVYFRVNSSGLTVTSLTCLTDCFTTGEYVYHKIDRNYLPDDIGSSPDLEQNDETASDYVKGRTHYVISEATEVVTNTLTWDGNTSGLENLPMSGTVAFYKVSDTTVTTADLIGGTVAVNIDGTESSVTLTEEMVNDESAEGIPAILVTIDDGPVLYVFMEDFSENGMIATKGMYFIRAVGEGTAYVASLTCLSDCFVVSTPELVKKIDGKFLPDGIGYIESSGGAAATNTLTFDGNIEGKEVVDGIVKVSDAVVTAYDLLGASIVVLTNGEEITGDGLLAENIVDMSSLGMPAIVIQGIIDGEELPLVLIVTSDYSADGMTATKGTYFTYLGETSYTKSLTCLTDCFVTGGGDTVHKLDPRILPDGYAYAEGESGVYLPEITVTIDRTENAAIIGAISSLQVGTTYVVTCNGVEYTCVAVDMSSLAAGYVGLGNLSEYNMEDTGEPFGFVTANGVGFVVAPGGTTLTLSIIKGKTVHTFDEKYMPDTMASKEYVKESITTSEKLSVSTHSLPSEMDKATAICYGNSKYVAVNGSYCSWSSDGFNWSDAITIGIASVTDICYGNGKYIAVGCNLSDKTSTVLAAYSTDGITWTTSNMPQPVYWNSVCYGNGKYVAVGGGHITSDLNDTDFIAYSEDGINWTEATAPTTTTTTPSYMDLIQICHGNGRYVAIGRNSVTGQSVTGQSVTGNTIYSEDGINWTTIPELESFGSHAVCYGENKLVVMGAIRVDDTHMLSTAYSEDGITWTLSVSSREWSGIFRKLCYGNGKYVAAGAIDNARCILYSEDGITWKDFSSFGLRSWGTFFGLCYGDGIFVTSIDNYAGGRIIYSENGIYWGRHSLMKHEEDVTKNVADAVNIYLSIDDKINTAVSDKVTTGELNTAIETAISGAIAASY